MMQLARRASLVVVLLLLASVGVASAECAWVPWQTIEVVDRFETRAGREVAIVLNAGFAPMRAFESKRDCDNAVSTREEPWPQLPLVIGERRAAHICFPETMDPRGPKK